MPKFADRLKLLRTQYGLSQRLLANKLGCISKSSINMYERGEREPGLELLEAIADFFNVDMDYLLGKSDIPNRSVFDTPLPSIATTNPNIGCGTEQKEPKYLNNAPSNEILTPDGKYITFKHPTITENTVTFPVIGEIAAGYDSIALEDWSGETVEIPENYLRGREKSDFIVLTVKGNSMYPIYLDGDKVLILKQPMVCTNGEVCAVLYDGEIGTLKKVIVHQDAESVELIPINPEYMPKTISGYDLESFKIIGIPKLLIREI